MTNTGSAIDTDLSRFLDQVSGRVSAALSAWLPDPAGDELAQAMAHIVFSGGKRLRPALVELGCLHVGGRPEQALAPAVAVELIHAYSLVHDDLPCMDDAELRRGKPCVHVLWGEAMGVLAGDALLTLAFEVLGRHALPGAPVADMLVTLGAAAGQAGMVGGQVDDLAAEGGPVDTEQVRRIHLGKTAALISGSLRVGAQAGGGTDQQVATLEQAGTDLGLAFQITDDLLDVEGDAALLGKAAGADAQADKATWPAAVGAEQARADATALVRRAQDAVRGGPQEALLVALGQHILARSH
ncbi:MAG: geranyl transferase [Planctomycetota bacterium]|nr:MAG: geranyl transferase [Planctomycetota bacterium]